MDNRAFATTAEVVRRRRGSRTLFFERLRRLARTKNIQPSFTPTQIAIASIGSFLGISSLAYLSMGTGHPLIAAPLGATSVLVFAVPDSPLAQPRNVLIGNLSGALVCVGLVAAFGSEPWVMGLAVAVTIALTQAMRTVHPPAGAVALVGVLDHANWDFVFTPVLVGSLVLVLWTLVLNLAPGRSYPRHW